MLQLIDLRGKTFTTAELLDLVPRAKVDVAATLPAVQEIISEVRQSGTAALISYAEKFDGVTPAQLRVPAAEIDKALAQLDPQVEAGLVEAISRTTKFHKATVPPPVELEVAPGAKLRQRWLPVERVGLYVPGGLAVYPSSVVMNVVAAQAAGVDSIAVASPPQKEFNGLPHPTILAACALLGVDEVYAVGGAQAIAMFAYGVPELCAPVNIVTGPGNIFVATAKRAVAGIVGTDGEAGPTEIAIIADNTADSSFLATDLISQAEHDPLAGSVLITHDANLAEQVQQDVQRLSKTTLHAQRVQQALSGEQSAIVLTTDLAQSVQVADAYGAEHLEIHTEDAAAVAQQIRHAGAIFIGPYSPVSLGDYLAGSNHVLPTGGTARFASGLNTTSFMKAVQYIDYSATALAAVGEKVINLAQAENLPAHGEAVAARLVEIADAGAEAEGEDG